MHTKCAFFERYWFGTNDISYRLLCSTASLCVCVDIKILSIDWSLEIVVGMATSLSPG